VNKYRDSWGITIANVSNGSRNYGIINYKLLGKYRGHGCKSLEQIKIKKSQRSNVPSEHHLCLSVLRLDLGQQCHQKEKYTLHSLVLRQISSSQHTQQNAGKVVGKFHTKTLEMSPSFSCRQENLCSLPKLIEEWNK